MQRALILGGTGKNSLGRALALRLIQDGITPILVGRTANIAAQDTGLKEAQYITADFMDADVSEQVMTALGEASDILYLVIAGGGPHLRGMTSSQSRAEKRRVRRTIAEGPAEIIEDFHAATRHPYHLITIASTSATQIRQDETVYATAQADRRAFALNFHYELVQRLGSKNLIVCPGGMKTGLWAGKDIDTSRFMEPMAVAQIIWETVREQIATLAELTIKRNPDGTPKPEKTIYTVNW